MPITYNILTPPLSQPASNIWKYCFFRLFLTFQAAMNVSEEESFWQQSLWVSQGLADVPFGKLDQLSSSLGFSSASLSSCYLQHWLPFKLNPKQFSFLFIAVQINFVLFSFFCQGWFKKTAWLLRMEALSARVVHPYKENISCRCKCTLMQTSGPYLIFVTKATRILV